MTQESLDPAIACPITLLVHIVVHHGPWAHDTKLSESRPVDSNYKSYNITMEAINTNINHMINHMGTPDIGFNYIVERPPSWAWARPITPTYGHYQNTTTLWEGWCIFFNFNFQYGYGNEGGQDDDDDSNDGKLSW